jgi:cytochrome c553
MKRAAHLWPTKLRIEGKPGCTTSRRTLHIALLLVVVLLAASCGGATKTGGRPKTRAKPYEKPRAEVSGVPGCQSRTRIATYNDQGYNDRCERYGSADWSMDRYALQLKGHATAGKAIFPRAGCGGCHTLAAAGTSGKVGPNLDKSKPSYELVVYRVTVGHGNMPSFATRLDPQQVADVAAYVSESTGGSGPPR